ncbi:MAG TPA: hypothetical protein ENK50_07990, partial [Sedimenticola sp.]|nr:hypothetical protein [Sedimenticola sp.]
MTTRGRRPPLAARLAAPLLGLLLTGGPALSRAGPDAVPALPGYRLGTFDPQRLQQGPDARGNWRLNGPADYAYAIERRCYCPAP